jgi:hypothetical protein
LTQAGVSNASKYIFVAFKYPASTNYSKQILGLKFSVSMNNDYAISAEKYIVAAAGDEQQRLHRQ